MKILLLVALIFSTGCTANGMRWAANRINAQSMHNLYATAAHRRNVGHFYAGCRQHNRGASSSNQVNCSGF